ncbi:aminotransferase class V-fold PLP-dependent enzyme [Shigella boydii]|uniref:aminotransferase class V-fold PLP-dependent enzyme n=1 Tax=Shigella boydii TaxID=621 RepID=UPI00253FC6A4|nr:aminotransferase class V-fold PLP-dependent enzyme [Shigella boydii]
MAQLLNAPDDKTIVWTRATTESINMVAQCYARPRLQPGDEIIVSVAEHHANLVPWLMVAQQTGAKVVKLPLNAQRLPDVDLLPELITPRSRILALGQMSNVTGGCPDLARAITFAHSAGMVEWSGGGAFPRRCSATGYRFLCFFRSQTVWPDRYRVLYGKPELLEAMSPWLGGGKMVHEVSFDGFTTQSAPWKLEAGTPNVAGVIGLSAALEWLADYDINQAESWSRSLANAGGRYAGKTSWLPLISLPGFQPAGL